MFAVLLGATAASNTVFLAHSEFFFRGGGAAAAPARGRLQKLRVGWEASRRAVRGVRNKAERDRRGMRRRFTEEGDSARGV